MPKPAIEPHICLPRNQRLSAMKGSSSRPMRSRESAALPVRSSRIISACCHQRVPGLRCMPPSAAAAWAAGDRPAAAARASEPGMEAADRGPDDRICPYVFCMGGLVWPNQGCSSLKASHIHAAAVVARAQAGDSLGMRLLNSTTTESVVRRSILLLEPAKS